MLFAEDEEGVRVSLRVLSGWCEQWSVEVNVEKCGVMHIGRRGLRGRGKSFMWIAIKKIEVVEYEYI